MSIVLQRVIKTPKIEINEQNAGYMMKIGELVELAGVAVFQANPDGSVHADYTSSLCIINDGRRSDEIGLLVGETKVKLGIKYGNANQFQDLQMEVTVVVKEAEKVEENPFTIGDETTALPSIPGEKQISFKKVVDEDGNYVFVGQNLYGEAGQALVDHFVLRQNLIDLIPEELWGDLEIIEKVNLKVNAVDVDGAVMEQFQLVRSKDDFQVDDEGFMVWELRTPQPLPFTNKGFSQQGVLGLNFEISFVAKFKEKENQDYGFWNSMVGQTPIEPQPEEATAQAPQDPFSGFQDFAKPTIPESTPEPVPAVEFAPPEPAVFQTSPMQSPSMENQAPTPHLGLDENKRIETPVADGWQTGFGSEKETDNQKPVDFSDAVSGLGEMNLQNQAPDQYPYGGGVPPVVAPQPQVEDNSYNGFERISGATMTYPANLLDTQGHPNPIYENQTQVTPSGSVMMSGVEQTSPGAATMGFHQPQGQGLKQDLNYNSVNNNFDIDQELKGLSSENLDNKANSQKGIKAKKKRNSDKRSKSKKAVIIGGIASALLIIGVGFAGMMYRNAGVAEMKDTKAQVEANLSSVDSILSDNEVSSSESVELQRLLNNNLELLENAKTSNYFANIERRGLVERSNKATDKAKELIQKQTGVSSQTPPSGTNTDGSQVKEPAQSTAQSSATQAPDTTNQPATPAQ